MHKILERLYREHTNLNQILDLLDAQLNAFNRGDSPDYDLLIELLDYTETFADQMHHPLEDLIYARVNPGEEHAVFDRLQSEHQSLVQFTRKFRQSLEGILCDGVMSREELETQGHEFLALQRQHLHLEEEEAFPLVDKLLGEEDWHEISNQLPRHEDPVFSHPDQIRFQNLFKYLADESGDDQGVKNPPFS
ncbi:MAG: hemerythrin domain-containing protein [Gammaproteobacteria bacterium]|nr:hemerythrin domain-containing protein [Gammaproteobacteria bacterium]